MFYVLCAGLVRCPSSSHRASLSCVPHVRTCLVHVLLSRAQSTCFRRRRQLTRRRDGQPLTLTVRRAPMASERNEHCTALDATRSPRFPSQKFLNTSTPTVRLLPAPCLQLRPFTVHSCIATRSSHLTTIQFAFDRYPCSSPISHEVYCRHDSLRVHVPESPFCLFFRAPISAEYTVPSSRCSTLLTYIKPRRILLEGWEIERHRAVVDRGPNLALLLIFAFSISPTPRISQQARFLLYCSCARYLISLLALSFNARVVPWIALVSPSSRLSFLEPHRANPTPGYSPTTY
jgi:hypothetical protein